MKFTLRLVPMTPEELVLTAEIPLSGVNFMAEAGRCLRRDLDTALRARHITLGNLARYDMSVPQQIAIESNFFQDKDLRYLPVSHGLLNRFIFHAATFRYGSSGKNYYPYYQNEIVLSSYIDELAVIDLWRSRGYPDTITDKINTGNVQIPLVDDAEDVTNVAQTGDVVLDDLYAGIDSIL